MEQLEAAHFILFSGPPDSTVASFLRTINPDAQWCEGLLQMPFSSAILTDVNIGFNAKNWPRSADPLPMLLEGMNSREKRTSWLQYVQPSNPCLARQQ